MIVLPHHMPYIRVGANSMALFRQDWLEDILVDAALQADVPQFIAEDISSGIYRSIEKSHKSSVIETEELFDRISTTLTSVGLEQMAEKIDRSPPTLRLSFSDLARRADKEYDLAFFQLLEDYFNEISQTGVTSVECHGLIQCARILCGIGVDQWSPEANEMQQRILDCVDEFRREGELRNPIFNVSVVY